MINSIDDKPDNKLALELLKGHLTDCEKLAFQCEINANDPPDLIVTWKHGERWGVEVTRAYQQVERIGDGTASSAEGVNAHLRRFAEELREKTKEIRRRAYTLYFEAPGPFSLWKHPVPLKQWKKDTEKRIRRHIACGESGVLRFSGGTLRPGEPGERWSLTIGSPVAELHPSTTAMLSRALRDKAKGLKEWDGGFGQRWLLLLNCYPLADDTAKIQNILRGLIREDVELAGFDGVFWSGFPDRTLFPISLSQNRDCSSEI